MLSWGERGRDGFFRFAKRRGGLHLVEQAMELCGVVLRAVDGLDGVDALSHLAKDDVAAVIVQDGVAALRVVALLGRDEKLRGVAIGLVHELL